MRKFILRLFPLVFLVCLGLPSIANPNPLTLTWQFKQADQDEWYAAQVPGCVHTDLIRNNIIPHPFYGQNENDCQWVATKNWIYESLPFSIDKAVLHKSIVRFRFNGLDTYADVFLNEQLLFQSDNAFCYWEADVKNILKSKNNILRIQFYSPLLIAEQRLKALPYPLPTDGERAVTRKPQFHYGWDWGPRIITCGITKSIDFIACDEARIENIYIEQSSVQEKKAKILTTFKIEVAKEGDYTIRFENIRNQEDWTTPVKLKRGINIVELPFDIEGPYRWWCNGQGNANLYTFISELYKDEKLIDTQSIQTGLRELELITQKDTIGSSFYFKLNGQPVYAKGANYIPLRYFPGEATEADYKNLLRNCKEANINMLRVWGGGVYEDDIFYQLCDEYGIMIWQDFMFSGAMYPSDSMFVTSVIQEATQQTIRLRNHPCIALWCGNNESSEGWENWGWQNELSEQEKFRLTRAYKDLFARTLPKVVAENTHTNYWQSSPSFGRADARSMTTGDAHYWGIWHDGAPFEALKQNIPRFMSEFGMQSFPSDAVLQEMTIEGNLEYGNPGFQQHQKHSRGFELMDKYMQSWFPSVSHDDLKFYSYMTQAVQAEGIAMGIEAQRRAMPRCMGTLYWQLNDLWPSFSWSSIDYLGNQKLLFQKLKILYSPQLISAIIENNTLFIYWINDNEKKEKSLQLVFSIYDGTKSIPETHDSEIALYTSKPEEVNLKSGSHIMKQFSLHEISKDFDPTDRIVLITLEDNRRKVLYSRKQKLTPNSRAFVVMP